MGFFSRAVLVFLMKESEKRRRKQPGKLMAKSRSQPVNVPGARPLMNPLYVNFDIVSYIICCCRYPTKDQITAVAQLIVQKFPALRDKSIGTGYVSYK